MPTRDTHLFALPHEPAPLTRRELLADAGRRQELGQGRLRVPVAAVPTVARPRVQQLLDEAIRHPVTLVTGGPGAGKTVAVADWTGHGDLPGPVVWVSLTSIEAHPGKLWHAVREAAGEILGEEPPHLVDGRADDLEQGFRLLDALGRRDVVLILDDVDLIGSGSGLRQLDAVLRRPPVGLRVLLIARHDPPMSLHRLRVAGDLAEVGPQQLAFTGPETDHLFGAGALPPEAIEHLVRVTDGWASGLRLASMALATADDPVAASAAFGGAHPLVTANVTEELACLEDDQRHVLLSICTVDEVCAGLAIALSGDPRAGALLRELAADSYLVPTAVGWYRQRILVRQALQAGPLATNPQLPAELNRRAATWFEGEGEDALALDHAVRSGDKAFMGALFLRAAVSSADVADGGSLHVQLARVPKPALTPGRPELLVARAWAKFLSGDSRGAVADLQHAEPDLQTPDPRSADATLALRVLQAIIAHGKGDATTMVSAARSAQELVTGPHAATEPRLSLSGIPTRLLALGELWLGRPQRMIDLVGWAGIHVDVPAARVFTGVPWQGHVALAEVSLGLVRQARLTAEAALSDADGPPEAGGGVAARGGPVNSAPAWLTLALVCLRQGDPGGAERALAGGERTNAGNPFIAAGLRVLDAQRRLAVGDLLGARDSLARLDVALVAEPPMPWIAAQRTSTAVRVALAAGLPARAAAILTAHDARVPPAEPDALALSRARLLLATHRQGGVPEAVAALLEARGALRAEAWLLVSLAEDALRRDAMATEALSQALDMAVSEGLVQPFLLPNPRLESMLRRHVDVVGTHGAFVDTVLAATYSDGPAMAAIGLEPLTERESSVLAYLPTLSSNGEIAAALSISVNTVKQHLKSINRKLQVGSRRDAVRVARRMHLLPRQSDY